MDGQLTNFVLKGGRVLDPSSGLDGERDIHIHDNIVTAIGADLKPGGATVIDVKGLIVTPGLIDVHLHLMNGLGAFGVDPDIFGVGSGVTTVVDAGSAGHSLLTVFRNYVTKNAKTRVLNYVNLSTLGGVTGPVTAFWLTRASSTKTRSKEPWKQTATSSSVSRSWPQAEPSEQKNSSNGTHRFSRG